MSERLSDRAGLFRLASWVVLLLSALFLLTSGGTYPGIASVEGHILGQVIAYAILGTWLVVAIARPEWRPATPLFWPVMAASAAYALAAVFSQRSRLSFEPTFAGLGWAAGLLFLTCLLARPWFRARVGALLTAFVAVVAIGYLVQVAIEWINWWQLIGRFATPPLRPSFAALFLGSPNLVATALILAAPLAIAIAWSRGSRGRLLANVLAIAAALAIFVSGSRSAYLGIGLAAIVGAGLLVSRTRLGDNEGLRSRPAKVTAIGLLVVGVLFAPSVLQRFAAGGADLRFDLWRAAAQIFTEHPVAGAGPGTWVQLKVAANPPGVPNLILPHAHDMYIQAAAELGVVGLLAGALLVFGVGRRLWAGWRSIDEPISFESAAVIVSLTAFAGQSIFDNLSNLPFVILLVAILVAWVDGRLAEQVPPTDEVRRGRPSIQLSPLPAAASLLALAVLVPTFPGIDAAALRAQEGNQRAMVGDWPGAMAAYDAAVDLDRSFTLYLLEAAGAHARLEDPQRAHELLAEAIKDDPVALNVIGLAAIEARALGEEELAAQHLEQAVALGYGDPVVALNAGLVAERLGDTATQIDQLANAVVWAPPLAADGFLWTKPTRGVYAEVVRVARNRTNELDRALILAYAGDVPGARAELERQPPSPARDTYLALVIGIGGETSTSLAMFEDLLARNPSDWFVAAMAARVANRAGMTAEAARYATWAIVVQGDAAPFVMAEAIAPAHRGDATASLPPNYPWSTYLRPITPFLPMPGLVLIGAR